MGKKGNWRNSQKIKKNDIKYIIRKAYNDNPDKLSSAQRLLLYWYSCRQNNLDPNVDNAIFRDLQSYANIILSKAVAKKGLELDEMMLLLVSDSRVDEEAIDRIEEYISDYYVDFMDWYEIGDSFNQQIRNYVLKEYPVKKYKNVLCVGDGEKCHLGRKLVREGYNVVSIDPVAEKDFSDPIVKAKNGKKSAIYVMSKEFSEESKDLIEWADIIVGCKVPMLAEILLKMPKPVVFNVSFNSEIHNISFNGIPVESGKHLQDLISASPGVHTMDVSGNMKWDPSEYAFLIFCKDLERDRKKAEPNYGRKPGGASLDD